MKKLLILILGFYGFLCANNNDKIINIKTTPEPPVLDGVIDPCWNRADSAVKFFQLSPYYGKKPTQKTVARILTTRKSLFCLMVCYDDQNQVQAYKGTLDNISGDNCSLMLDTFGNSRTAYKFAVSASGVRSDCRLVDDARNRDYSWDGIWFAESKVYDW